jgi:hAT family C-terminal dimerisation region
MLVNQSSRDVCQWMKVSQGMYPRITLMARKFLGVTSTSVPSEIAFSKAGTTVDKLQARLGDEAVQAICELQSFLVFNKPRRTYKHGNKAF